MMMWNGLKLKESSNTFNVMLNDVNTAKSGKGARFVGAKDPMILT